MERRDPSYTGGGKVNWYSQYRGQYEDSLKKKNPKNRATYDPTTQFMGVYPEKNMIQKDSCTLIFIAALLTMAKT